MRNSGDAFLFVMMVIFVVVVLVAVLDAPRRGNLTLRPVACAMVKSAGVVPATTDGGCTLESKYNIGRSFTELRLPNKQKLLVSNAEISGIVRK